MPEILLTVPQVAAMLNVSGETIRRWAKLGDLPAVRLPSGKFLFRRGDIERILQPDEVA